MVLVGHHNYIPVSPIVCIRPVLATRPSRVFQGPVSTATRGLVFPQIWTCLSPSSDSRPEVSCMPLANTRTANSARHLLLHRPTRQRFTCKYSYLSLSNFPWSRPIDIYNISDIYESPPHSSVLRLLSSHAFLFYVLDFVHPSLLWPAPLPRPLSITLFPHCPRIVL